MLLWKGYVVRPWKHTDALVICNIEARVISCTGSSAPYPTTASYNISGTRTSNYKYDTDLAFKRWRIALDYQYVDNIPEIYLETYHKRSGSSEGNPIQVIPELGFYQLSYSGFGGKVISNIQQGTYDVVGDNDIMIGSEYTITDVGSDFTWPAV